MGGPVYHLEKVVKARAEGLEDFSGPLDLILHLLSKNRMEIRDIQISVILEQYLEWMEERKRLDLDVASEFVAMAAQLIFIKSRMLLSLHDEDVLSEVEELVASLEARQRQEDFRKISSVVPELERRYTVGRNFLSRGPEPLSPDRSYRYVHIPDDLRHAMMALRERMGDRVPPTMAAFAGIVGKEPYPVAEKAGELLARLVRVGVTRFRVLFQGNRSRSEIVATFIAVLELCKARRIFLAGVGEDCTVACTGDEGSSLKLSTDVN